MATITTKQEALEKMFPDDASKRDISYVLSGFDGALLLSTEDQMKEELKKAFPDVTDWGF